MPSTMRLQGPSLRERGGRFLHYPSVPVELNGTSPLTSTTLNPRTSISRPAGRRLTRMRRRAERSRPPANQRQPARTSARKCVPRVPRARNAVTNATNPTSSTRASATVPRTRNATATGPRMRCGTSSTTPWRTSSTPCTTLRSIGLKNGTPSTLDRSCVSMFVF